MSSRLEIARHRVGARGERHVMILDVRRGPNAALDSRPIGSAADLGPFPTDLDRAAVEEERVRRLAQQIAHCYHCSGCCRVLRYDGRISCSHEAGGGMPPDEHAV